MQDLTVSPFSLAASNGECGTAFALLYQAIQVSQYSSLCFLDSKGKFIQ